VTTPYSLDLRERVVGAVDHGGMSRNQAAARYGVAANSAVKWVARFRATGSAAPAKMGGDKPKTLRGEHAEWLIARCKERAFTLSQLVEEVLELRGLKVDRRSVWEFVHAEGRSYKKTCSPRSRTGPTSPGGVSSGKSIKGVSMRSAWFSLTGPPPSRGQAVDEDQHDAVARMGPVRGAREGQSSIRPLEDDGVHRRSQA